MSASVTLRRSLLLVACVLLALLPLTAAVDMAKYNLRTGKKFLADNAAAEGVTALPSGLQYKVLTAGSGTASPSATDQVKVHYQGTLLSGKEFDSSYKRGEPATFGVNQVIKISAARTPHQCNRGHDRRTLSSPVRSVCRLRCARQRQCASERMRSLSLCPGCVLPPH